MEGTWDQVAQLYGPDTQQPSARGTGPLLTQKEPVPILFRESQASFRGHTKLVTRYPGPQLHLAWGF